MNVLAVYVERGMTTSFLTALFNLFFNSCMQLGQNAVHGKVAFSSRSVCYDVTQNFSLS